jgi:hypothetical protein
MTTDSNSAGSGSREPPSDADSRRPTASDNPQADKEAVEKNDTADVEPDAGDKASSSDETKNSESEGTSQANKLDPPVCAVRVLGQCLLGGETGSASQKPDGGKATSAAQELPPAMRAGLKGLVPAADVGAAKSVAPSASPDRSKTMLAADDRPQAKAADQSDDLLSPNEQELREIKAHNKGVDRPAEPGDSDASAKPLADVPSNAAANPQPSPVISIESDVDPESWAEYGGWYRQDYAIFYRPTGHKDKFIYSWLFLTGPRAPKGDASPSAAVFGSLTSKDAPGSCTKCHSVDDIQGRGRLVNFSQPSAEMKRGSFTKFVHEPHFNIMENGGCLACHNLEKTAPYLKSYEQGNPKIFASSFAAIRKDTCQACHQSGVARQDCLLCHNYHVNGVTAPIMNTKVPMQ